MAAKFFTGLPLDGPDPECVLGHGERALARLGAGGSSARRLPVHGGRGHGKPGRPVPVAFGSLGASLTR
jgi:hypothetical protein